MSAKVYQLVAFALSIVQITGWSSYVCAQSRNEIHGLVCAGAGASTAADNPPIVGVVVEAFGGDNKVITTAVTATDAKGRFSIIVPVEVKAYRLFIYDPNADYWIFHPKGEKINDKHPMDLGRILLYPRNTKLAEDELLEQFEDAKFIASVDKAAGEIAMRRMTSEYPKIVEISEVEIAQAQKQRVLGIFPNFYVTYDVPTPLTPKEKFKLALRSTVDPITFLGVGALAGFQQAADDFGGYGQGAEGYAKRYGAAYAGVFTHTLIGSAIMPSLLKQDPRYFYKGTGSTRSRVLYALANAVICKGDNQRWQPNYSGFIGSVASGGISYLYYPASDRNAGLFVQNSLIGLGESAVAGVFQEFFLHKLTLHHNARPPKSDPAAHP